MDNTSSFTNLMNSAFTSVDPEKQVSQQHHFPSPQYPMSYPPPQFPPNFHHPYPRIFNPFGAQPNYPQFSFTQGYPGSSYQGAVGVGQHPQGGSQASPVGSIAFFQGSRATDSRGDVSTRLVQLLQCPKSSNLVQILSKQQFGVRGVRAALMS